MNLLKIKYVKDKKDNNRTLLKEGHKILAFITFKNEKIGYSYAFGSPSQIGGYIEFYNNNYLTFEDAQNRILERLL